jgi:L-lactate dehydrogenase complex protein LldG
VSGFDTVLARIRQGLNPGATEQPTDPAVAPAQATAPRTLDADELRAQFIAALSAVRGNAIEASDEAGAVEKIAELLRSAGLPSAAIGEGLTTDSASAAVRLARDGCQITKISRQNGTHGGLKETLSVIDAGIVEADYAIASTGTLVMVADAARPRSLSLLPPINIVLLRSSRILPDLAAVLRTIGPQTIAAHSMVLVTGPSRTADIEKRIVIGVHGPKELHVVIIWQSAKGGPDS